MGAAVETLRVAGRLADAPAPESETFAREDWTLFRSVETLGQKAGVPRHRLAQLVAKELADNALDATGAVRYGQLEGGAFYVEDDGPGLDPAAVPVLFSINRPLVSSKLVRMPTRGALGNGLRVVVGAVVASGGSMTVATRGEVFRLEFTDEGRTLVRPAGATAHRGLRVEVTLGEALRPAGDVLAWVRTANTLAHGGATYAGKSSPHWYDADAFFELCQAAGDRSARELVSTLDGCTGAKAGQIAEQYRGRLARSLSREDATRLLLYARAVARPVSPERLGAIGRGVVSLAGYGREVGCFAAGAREPAALPFVAEAFASPLDGADDASVTVAVNRTPVTASVVSWHEKGTQYIDGCGLRLAVPAGRRAARVLLNVTTPYMPVTSDGKAPDLGRAGLVDAIERAICSAVGRGKRAVATNDDGRPRTQKEIILAALPEAIDKASGGGTYRFSLRQLFYAVRPALLEATGKEPSYDTFGKVITDHEADAGEDIPGMYRDPRGTLYHPHTGEEIALGTIAVESYRRPAWTFNKILYSEKEGLLATLRAARWPERHDCALVSSKGFASRAVRDLLDLLGDSGEEITLFAIHDADGPGTLIYETLQGETKARPGRRVRIVNLGLEPGEAVSMGLQIEPVQRRDGDAVPVAEYVPAPWREWLQSHRAELNAMTAPQFIAWLDAKIAEHDTGKVVPPAEVLRGHLADVVREGVREQLAAEALRAARVDERTEAAVSALAGRLDALTDELDDRVRDALDDEPHERWTAPLAALADEIAAEAIDAEEGGAP